MNTNTSKKQKDVKHSVTMNIDSGGTATFEFVNPEDWPVGKMSRQLNRAPRNLKQLQNQIRHAEQKKIRDAERKANEEAAALAEAEAIAESEAIQAEKHRKARIVEIVDLLGSEPANAEELSEELRELSAKTPAEKAEEAPEETTNQTNEEVNENGNSSGKGSEGEEGSGGKVESKSGTEEAVRGAGSSKSEVSAGDAGNDKADAKSK